ncbi:MAG: cysteine desulfurase [Agathobacter sp.]|nr:cysteine desulfurase [Agathobacter sp.]
MECYFDNAATTRCGKEAAELMMAVLTQGYGNPSSLHQKGVEAEQYIRAAREKIARTLKCKEKEIFFTSGGTESNNLAIVGAVEANRRAGKHIITTAVEHPSVSAPMAWLQEQGWELTILPVDHEGVISLDALRASVREDTVLVSMMQVNNEIGAIQPIREAAAIVRERNPRALIHVDAIQSYGKIPVFPGSLGIDLMSVSGHKIRGPKGSGFLYVRDKTRIHPILRGGGQQKGMRSGTENVPAIAGLGVAAEESCSDFEAKAEHLYGLRERFVAGLADFEGVSVNGRPGRGSAPHIVSVSVEGVRAEVLLHALEEREIYVSAGSACSSNKPSVSATLQAIGLKPSLLDSTVRFSFSADNAAEEIDYALEQLRELIPSLRRYTRH